MSDLLIEYGKHTEVYSKWVLHFYLSLSMPTLENFSLFEIPGILVNVLAVGYMLYAVWRRGGVKNATFNARIKSTAGITSRPSNFMHTLPLAV